MGRFHSFCFVHEILVGNSYYYCETSYHDMLYMELEILFICSGGLFIMTGDVLPCFDASNLILPDDASCIITVPITLDIASNHGVVVASKSGSAESNYIVSSVDNLLQKPSLEELVKSNAILDDGRTLLDTGIIAVRGKAWLELVKLALSCEPLISELLDSRKEAGFCSYMFLSSYL